MGNNEKNNDMQEPLYQYQFIDTSGCIFTVTAPNRTIAAKIAREQMG